MNRKLLVLILVLGVGILGLASAQDTTVSDGIQNKEADSGSENFNNDLILNLTRETGQRNLPNYEVKRGGIDLGHFTGFNILSAESPERDLDKKVRNFLGDNDEVFGINQENLALKYSPGINEDISILKYEQEFKGLPVFSSRFIMAIKDGNGICTKSNYFPGINLSIIPELDEHDAIRRAANDLNVSLAGDKKVENISLIIYPREIGARNEYILAFKLDLGFLNNPPQKWIYIIDANSGEILEKYNKVIFNKLNGQVEGRIYPEHTNQTPITVGFSNETIFGEFHTIYPNNVFWSGSVSNGRMASKSYIDLGNATSAKLRFTGKHLFKKYDEWGEVRVSTDGSYFSTLKNFQGIQYDWSNELIDLSYYAGNKIWLSFEFKKFSPPNMSGDGWYIDNIEVISNNGMIFQDIGDNNLSAWNTSEFNVVEDKEAQQVELGNTGFGGDYGFSNLSENLTIRSELEGPFIDVNNYLAPDAHYESNVTVPGNHSWDWANYDLSDRNEESNVFYHANIVHDYFTGGNSFDIHAMDYKMQAFVEYPGSCNAFATGTDIYFYGAGYSCEATSLLSDVIYHEYTHNVVEHIYSSYFPYYGESGALNEGWADYFSATINNNSCMAEGFFIGESCLRDLNNSLRYPEDLSGEVHWDGRIASGAMWDLRLAMGADIADALIINSMKLEPFNFSEFLDDIITVNDDNGNLDDGTPNLEEICESFYENHGIYSRYCDVLYPDIWVSPPGLAVSVYAGNSSEKNIILGNRGGGLLNFNITSDTRIFTGDTVFSDDFESGAPGWSHYKIEDSYYISDDWSLSEKSPWNMGHSWHSGKETSSNEGGDTALESPSIDLTNISSAYLSFDTWYDFDAYSTSYYDGGIVEIWDGGSWSQIYPIGVYPVKLSQGYDNPLEGLQAFGGQSHGWETEFVNISEFTGKTIKIRFHVGWDFWGGEGKEGWYLDNFAVVSGGAQWLASNPVGGSIDVGSSQIINLSLNSSGMQAGRYSADIIIENNDFSDNPFKVPVEFNVVDPGPPSITILQPGNITYNISAIPIEYMAGLAVNWSGYSLDGGEIINISGNPIVAGLDNGPHSITIFVRDLMGVQNSDTVNFSISSPDIWFGSEEINMTLFQDQTANTTIIIGNNGQSLLECNFSIRGQIKGSPKKHETNSTTAPTILPLDEALSFDHVPGELLVKFKEASSFAEISDLYGSLNATLLKEYPSIGFVLIKVEESLLKDRFAFLMGSELIESVEPNYLFSATGIPDDTLFKQLWGMHNTGQTGGTDDSDIDSPEAWDIYTGDHEVVVAVIDTGVDYTHEDLLDNIWTNPGEIEGNGIDDDGNGFVDDYYGWDFAYDDNDPMDRHSHGTHCSGTIGGVGNNGIGVAGVSWKVRIMPVKFLSDGGSGSTSDAIDSIEYATMMGADIMSNSWGGGGYSAALEETIKNADESGSLFVAAAGNNGMDTDYYPHYPSSYDVPNVMSIAATDDMDRLAYFSNYGNRTVHMGAPGVDVLSSVPGDSYSTKSGTSMATPHVAGAAALIKSYNPGLTHIEIKEILMVSGDSIPSLEGRTVSGGRLNIHKALISTTPPWLSVRPLNGSISIANQTDIIVMLNSTGLKNGTYIANILIESTDLDETPFYIPVNLDVIDRTPPSIEIFSPGNITYNQSGVKLAYSIYEESIWTGYSLDGRANLTISGNMTLANLKDGQHSLTLYSQDTGGNWNSTTRYFFVAAPDMWIGPTEINITLFQGENRNRTLTIGNNGTGLLEIIVEGGGEGYLVINEICTDDNDWIEVYNSGYSSISLDGWKLYADEYPTQGGISYSFPKDFILPPNSHVQIHESCGNNDEDDLYICSNIYWNSPAESPSMVSLEDNTGNIIDYVEWSAGGSGYGGKYPRGKWDGKLIQKQGEDIIFRNDDSDSDDADDWTFSMFSSTPKSPNPGQDGIGKTSWLDLIQKNFTILAGNNENLTLSINGSGIHNGSHRGLIRIESNDLDETPLLVPINMNVIDITQPGLTLSSPQNLTYNQSSVVLKYSSNEETSWVGYSLDDGVNVTLSGNSTLSNLGDGQHRLVIFAKDLGGNWNSSMVHFSVASPDIRVTPAGFNLTMLQNQMETMEVTIGNDGIGPLEFEVAGNVGNNNRYYPVGIPFQWVDGITYGYNLRLTDDSYRTRGLPFRFNFFGIDYYQIFVGANGWLSFETPPQSIPGSMELPTNEWKSTIFVIGDDWVPDAGGGVYEEYLSNPGRYVITWNQVPHIKTKGSNTFQVILYESGEIRFNYMNLENPETFTIGLNKGDGAHGVDYGKMPVPNTSVMFDHSPLEFKSDPDSGVVGVGEKIDLTVGINAMNLRNGSFRSGIYIESNDMDDAPWIIPVNLDVLDITPPELSLLSPRAITYEQNWVELRYSLNEEVSWVGYSLDGGPNVSITGSKKLADLSNGQHNLTLYARDFGDNWDSATVDFTTLHPAMLSDNFSDFGLDEDGDGLYDYLAIDVGLDVAKSGDYRVRGELYDSNGRYLGYENIYPFMEVGLQKAQLKFDGFKIFQNGKDGPYYLKYVYVYDNYGTRLDYEYDAHKTSFYKYTDFQGPPAKLNGNYSDSGLDEDGDGLFDYLAIDVGLNVSKSGKYRVSGELYDGYGNNLDYDYNYTFTETGNQSIQLRFEGIRIHQNKRNGPYLLRYLYLYDENYTRLEYKYDAAKTNDYNYTSFQRPAAMFSGNYSDSGLDEDGNGLFDYLTIDVGMNVSKSGNYRIQGELYDNEGRQLDYDSQSTYLEPGNQSVQLEFEGYKIFQNRQDGPYRLRYLYIYDENYRRLDYEYDAYRTSAYKYTDFQKPPAVFIGNYSDSGLDEDGDGLFDYLVIDVGINVSESGNYQVRGELYDDYGNNLDYENTHTYLESGNQSVQLNFQGYLIYMNGRNGPYRLRYLYLYDSSGNRLDYYRDAYTTSFYDYSEFQRPPATLSDYYSDFGLDEDGDGLYDYLVINVGLHVNKSGQYQVRGELYDASGRYLDYEGSYPYLETGNQSVQLKFDGYSIFRNERDGPYLLRYLYLYDNKGNRIGYDYDAYETFFYNYNDFRKQPLKVNPPPPSPSPVGGSGGGSGGSSGAASFISRVGPGQMGIAKFSKTSSPYISEIELTLLKEVYSISISLKYPEKKPFGTSDILEKVYKYIEIIKSNNIKDEDIDTANIKFKVEKEWFENNSADRIVMLRNVDGIWERLETLEIGEDNENKYFSAHTPGFSHFAIVGEKVVLLPTEDLPSITQDSENVQIPDLDIDITSELEPVNVSETSEISVLEPEKQELETREETGFPIFIFILVGSLAAGAGYYIYLKSG